MNNKYFHPNSQKIRLIALSLMGAIALSIPFNITINSVFAENNINANKSKKAQGEKLYKEGYNLYKQGTKESSEQAIIKFKQALPLYQEIGAKLSYANTAVLIGLINDNLGFKQEALSYYNQALPLYKALGNKKGEATTLNNIGLVYDDLGELKKALEYYQQALSLDNSVGNKKGEATTLNNIGSVYSALGEKQKALEYYQQALKLHNAVGNREDEVTTLNNIGSVYSVLGDQQKALEYYQLALPLSKTMGNKKGEATALNNIGLVYSNLGQKQKALEYYLQALSLSKTMGDREGEATNLTNIGAIYSALGEQQKALEYYLQALSLSKTLGDVRGVGGILNNIGFVYSNLGERQKALEYYQEALTLYKKMGDRSGGAHTLNNIGFIYSDLGEKQKALEYYQEALTLYETVGDRSGVANTLWNMTDLEYSQGNLQTALIHIKSAVAIIEDLRSKIISQDLKTSYFATVQDYYQMYIIILMKLHKKNPKLGYNITSFEISEQARSRSLLDLLNESKADIKKDFDPQLKQKEQKLIQKLAAKTQEQLKLSSQPEYSEKEFHQLVKEIDEIKTQLQQIEVEIRRKNPRYAALTQVQTLKLQDIQQQLDKDTVLLSYWVGDNESYLWVISSNSLTSYLLPNETEIKKLAGGFLADTLDGDISLKRAKIKAIELTKIILKPAQSQLQNKRLIIVPDGKLQYIPFNALATLNSTNDKDFKPLLFDHEIINLPSASTIGFIRKDTEKKKIAPKTIAVIADPVFGSDDKRVKIGNRGRNNLNSNNLEKIKRSLGTRGDFKPLPFTRKEAENILSLVPKSQSKIFFDFEANLTNMNNADLSQYRIIHLGTHGFINQENPELSGIVLSLFDKEGKEQNGLLMTPDIFNLNLPADLIVLSACETAKGKDVKGEGIVGLTRGFMYAGTSRLMLSLWQVDDQATSVLMSKFYQGMLQEKLTPAAALRKAQLSMWNEGKAPYYWSAFILQGEWK